MRDAVFEKTVSCVKSKPFVSAVFPFSPFSRFRGFRVFAWPAPASPGAETHVSYAQTRASLLGARTLLGARGLIRSKGHRY